MNATFLSFSSANKKHKLKVFIKKSFRATIQRRRLKQNFFVPKNVQKKVQIDFVLFPRPEYDNRKLLFAQNPNQILTKRKVTYSEIDISNSMKSEIDWVLT
jgi:hypothetical protein